MLDNSVYVGYTSNIQKRIDEHNNCRVRSTKAKVPYKLIYCEGYLSKTVARKREIAIKKNYQAKKEILDRLIDIAT
jgi:putative endonuclease